MKRLNLLSATILIAAAQIASAETSSDCRISPSISFNGAGFLPDQIIYANFALTNIGGKSCTLPADLLPEGWIIQVFVKDSRGALVYGSRPTKVEMTGSKMQEQIVLLPKHVHGVGLELGKFPPGEYVVDGRFSTQQLASWKIKDLPIGSWDAPTVMFRVRISSQ